MPQLSLYLDEETHRQVETRARLSNASVSKYVSIILKGHFSHDWPEGFDNVFGSITDDTFHRHSQPPSSLDVAREEI